MYKLSSVGRQNTESFEFNTSFVYSSNAVVCTVHATLLAYDTLPLACLLMRLLDDTVREVVSSFVRILLFLRDQGRMVFDADGKTVFLARHKH